MRRFVGDEIVMATGNAGKLLEFRALLEPFVGHVMSLADFNLTEPPETAFTFAGNARIKARAAATATGLPALADDSGLSVDALGGAPGIYTADWAETGGGRDFNIAMAKTWDLASAVATVSPHHAQFQVRAGAGLAGRIK